MSYDDYCLYEDHAYEFPTCSKCDKKDEMLQNATYFLEKVVKMLYTKEMFDCVSFEAALDELCYALDVNTGIGDLQVVPLQHTRKQIHPWINSNNDVLKQFSKAC